MIWKFYFQISVLDLQVFHERDRSDAWVLASERQFMAPLLSSCGTLGKLINPCKLQFPHVWDESSFSHQLWVLTMQQALFQALGWEKTEDGSAFTTEGDGKWTNWKPLFHISGGGKGSKPGWGMMEGQVNVLWKECQGRTVPRSFEQGPEWGNRISNLERSIGGQWQDQRLESREVAREGISWGCCND